MTTQLEFPADTEAKNASSSPVSSAQAPAQLNSAAGMLPAWLALSAVCALGLLLRLHALTASSLWIDEGVSAMIVRLPWPGFLALMQGREGNMALYYLLLRGWTHLGGSEFVLRGMSVLTGVLALPATYVLGKRLFSPRVGILAALLLAVHAFDLRYSQEARSYSLVILLLLLAAYCLLRAVESNADGYWLGFVVFSALAVYAHFFAALVVMAQLASLAFLPALGTFRHRLFGALALLAGLLAPAAWYVHSHAHVGLLDWVPAPTWPVVYSSALGLSGAGGAQLLIAYLLACALAFLPSAALASQMAPRPQRFPLALVLLWAIFPGLFLFGVSLFKPLLLARYLSISIPGLVLLAAAGLARLRPRWQLLATSLLVLLSLLGVRAYFVGPWRGDQDWRGAVAYATQHAAAGDVVLLRNGVSRPVFEYYRRQSGDFAPRVFSPLPRTDEMTIVDFEGQPNPRIVNILANTHDRVWTFDWTADGVLSGLLDGRFHRADVRHFAGLNLALYISNDASAPR